MTVMAQSYLGKPFIEQKNKQVLVYVIMGSLLCLRGLNDLFLYPAIVLGVSVILFADQRIGLPFLFFILPFGTIFKFSPGQFSFFTVLFFLFVVRQFLRKGIRLLVFISCMILGGYLILLSGVEQSVTIITMLTGIVFVSYSVSGENSLKEILLAYSIGIILASALGLMQDFFPIIKNFVVDVVLRLGESERVNRFSGLQGNPNYFTVDIIMVLSGIAILLFQERNKLLYIILFIVLTAIGLMSLSKSFLISWLALMIFMFMFIVGTRRKKVKKLIFILVGIIGMVYLIAAEEINDYIIRFINSMGSVSDLTTGRTDIWSNYIAAIWGNIKILFFGNGINGELVNGKAPHNTYIELIYSMGILGVMIYIFVLHECLKKRHKARNIIQYLPMMLLLIRFFAIGLLTYDNLWFYLTLVAISLAPIKSDKSSNSYAG